MGPGSRSWINSRKPKEIKKNDDGSIVSDQTLNKTSKKYFSQIKKNHVVVVLFFKASIPVRYLRFDSADLGLNQLVKIFDILSQKQKTKKGFGGF